MSILKSLYSFRGRTGRLYYAIFYLIHAGLLGIAGIFAHFAVWKYADQGSAYRLPAIAAFLLATAILFLPAAAVVTRRLHDRGRSGWWLVLGLALAFLAVATVLKYDPDFDYLTVHSGNLVKFVTGLIVFAMLGFVPWSAFVLVASRGDAGYSYLLPALLGVGPLLIFGVWFLIEIAIRRGAPGANAYGPAPIGWLGSHAATTAEARRAPWLPIGGAALAAIAGIVLLSGVLERYPTPCDVALTVSATPPTDAREFEDCFEVKGARACAPRMVVIPAGSFQMGGPNTQPAKAMPVHAVTFARPYALGKFEVSVAHWHACVLDGGCAEDPRFKAWQQRARDKLTLAHCRLPVGATWNIISSSYLPWLARKTGKPYRLPSESEWENAARAGIKTEFPNGYTISTDYENYDDQPGKQCSTNAKVLDVGSLKPNQLGLHDMLGNRKEWVADVDNWGRFDLAPTDGSAWMQAMQTSPMGIMRVIRGLDYCTKANALSPSSRTSGFPDKHGAGFRVALSLPGAASVATAPASGGPGPTQPVTLKAAPPQETKADAAPPAAKNAPAPSAADAWQRGDDSRCWASPNAFEYTPAQVRAANLARLDYCERTIAYQARAGKSAGEIARARYSRGDALRQLGRLDEALAEFKVADADAPNNGWELSIFDILFEKKQYKEALEAFDKNKLFKPSADQMLGRAQALEALGRKKETIDAYRKYGERYGGTYEQNAVFVTKERKLAAEALARLGADPLPPLTRKVLSAGEKAAYEPYEVCDKDMLDWTIDEKILACTQTINNRLKSGSSANDVYVLRGNYYVKKRDFARAEADFNRVIESGGSAVVSAYDGRGKAYEGLGRKADAISDWRLVNKQRPCDQAVRQGLTRLGHEPLPLPSGCDKHWTGGTGGFIPF